MFTPMFTISPYGMQRQIAYALNRAAAYSVRNEKKTLSTYLYMYIYIHNNFYVVNFLSTNHLY